MAKHYIKRGIAAGLMYETINDLTGIIDEDEFGNLTYGPQVIGDGVIQIGGDGSLTLNPKIPRPSTLDPDIGIVYGSMENAEKLGGKVPQYYGLNTDTVHEYTHTYDEDTKTHNFSTPDLSIDNENWSVGRVKITSPFFDGDNFALNGVAATAYIGNDAMDELYVDRYMMFVYDSTNNVINFIGNGTSKLLLKASKATEDNILRSDASIGLGGTKYIIKGDGNATLNETTVDKLQTSAATNAARVEGTTFYGSLNVNNTQSITSAGPATLNHLLVTTINSTAGGGTGTPILDAAGHIIHAVYNDYAEFFPRGEETEPGDIIMLDVNSDEEKYVRAVAGGPIVGVHSNEFAHVLGGENVPYGEDFIEYNLKKYIPISLAGRVHVKVIGKVKKGENIYPSQVPGVGLAGYNPGKSIGMALESSDDEGVKLIKIKVR